MKRADRITAVTLFGVCLYAWIRAERFSSLSGLFPKAVVIVLFFLSLILLVMSFVKPPEGKAFVFPGGVVPLLQTGVLMTAWVALIGVFGFLSSSLVFFSLMSVTIDRRELKPLQILRRLLLVWVITAGFYFFFDRVLMVLLPRGVLI